MAEERVPSEARLGPPGSPCQVLCVIKCNLRSDRLGQPGLEGPDPRRPLGARRGDLEGDAVIAGEAQRLLLNDCGLESQSIVVGKLRVAPGRASGMAGIRVV